MKKIITILFLILVTVMASNAQVKVLGKIIPNGVIDQYPTHIDSLGQGGLITAKTWQERNSIPLPRRKAGMLVRVKSATVDSTYTLGVGLTNSDWQVFATGGGGSIPGLQDSLFKKVNRTGDTMTGSLNFGADPNNQIALSASKLVAKETIGSLYQAELNGGSGLQLATEGISVQYGYDGINKIQGGVGKAYTWPTNSGRLATVGDIPAPIDISGKEDKSNKATNLNSPNNTTYPTTQAVLNALSSVKVDSVLKYGNNVATGDSIIVLRKEGNKWDPSMTDIAQIRFDGDYNDIRFDASTSIADANLTLHNSGVYSRFRRDTVTNHINIMPEYGVSTLKTTSTIPQTSNYLEFTNDGIRTSREEGGGTSTGFKTYYFRNAPSGYNQASRDTVATLADIRNKADNSNVLHRIGDETFTGKKTGHYVGVDSLIFNQVDGDNRFMYFGGTTGEVGLNAHQFKWGYGPNGIVPNIRRDLVLYSKYAATGQDQTWVPVVRFNRNSMEVNNHIITKTLAVDTIIRGGRIVVPNVSAIDTMAVRGDLNNKLSKSGDTMAGTLTVPNLNVGSTSLGKIETVASQSVGAFSDGSGVRIMGGNRSVTSPLIQLVDRDMLPGSFKQITMGQQNGSTVTPWMTLQNTAIRAYNKLTAEQGLDVTNGVLTLSQSNSWTETPTSGLVLNNTRGNDVGAHNSPSIFFRGNKRSDNTSDRTSFRLSSDDTEFSILRSRDGEVTWQNMLRIGPGDVLLPASSGINYSLNSSEITDSRSYTLPNKNGTVAMVDDIPKMFTYTASGDGVINEFTIPHGLSYTPTMVLITPNSIDAASTIREGAQQGAGSFAYISGSNIIIKVSGLGGVDFFPAGTNNLTWTILVK